MMAETDLGSRQQRYVVDNLKEEVVIREQNIQMAAQLLEELKG